MDDAYKIHILSHLGIIIHKDTAEDIKFKLDLLQKQCEMNAEFRYKEAMLREKLCRDKYEYENIYYVLLVILSIAVALMFLR